MDQRCLPAFSLKQLLEFCRNVVKALFTVDMVERCSPRMLDGLCWIFFLHSPVHFHFISRAPSHPYLGQGIDFLVETASLVDLFQ